MRKEILDIISIKSKDKDYIWNKVYRLVNSYENLSILEIDLIIDFYYDTFWIRWFELTHKKLSDKLNELQSEFIEHN